MHQNLLLHTAAIVKDITEETSTLHSIRWLHSAESALAPLTCQTWTSTALPAWAWPTLRLPFQSRTVSTVRTCLTGTWRQSANIGAGNSNQRDSAAMSVSKCVESHSRHFALAAGHNSTWVFSPVQAQTALLQWRGSVYNTTPKFLCFETGGSQLARKGSDRASPTEQVGERVVQPVFCGTQERWGTPSDSGPETHQPSTHKHTFRMMTLKQILAQIHPGVWFSSVDLKDVYFHVQIATRHKRFLRFAFVGTAYQYSVIPFGLALARYSAFSFQRG